LHFATLLFAQDDTPSPFVILRACNRFDFATLLFAKDNTLLPFVILRACNFLILQRCCLFKTIPSPLSVILNAAPE